MLKYLMLGMSVLALAAPAHAAEMSCRMTASEQQAFINMGYPGNAQQVMHLSVDKNARQVTVWETSPEFPAVSKSVYNAEFTGNMAAWTIGDLEDGPQAHDSVDLSTNVLTTIDPNDESVQWNCSAD